MTSIAAVVTKDYPSQTLGISLRYVSGTFYVSELTPESPFRQTKLRQGMRVTNINGNGLAGKDISFAMNILRKSRDSVYVIATDEVASLTPPRKPRTITCRVHKSSPNQSLGITLMRDNSTGEFMVCRLAPDSLFRSSSSLEVGMTVLRINGVEIRGQGMPLVLSLLKESVGEVVLVAETMDNVVETRRTTESNNYNGYNDDSQQDETTTKTMNVTILRRSTNDRLGMSLVRDPENGHFHVYRLARDSPYYVNGLRKGMRVLSVKGDEITGLSMEYALQLLRDAVGVVTITATRVVRTTPTTTTTRNTATRPLPPPPPGRTNKVPSTFPVPTAPPPPSWTTTTTTTTTSDEPTTESQYDYDDDDFPAVTLVAVPTFHHATSGGTNNNNQTVANVDGHDEGEVIVVDDTQPPAETTSAPEAKRKISNDTRKTTGTGRTTTPRRGRSTPNKKIGRSMTVFISATKETIDTNLGITLEKDSTRGIFKIQQIARYSPFLLNYTIPSNDNDDDDDGTSKNNDNDTAASTKKKMTTKKKKKKFVLRAGMIVDEINHIRIRGKDMKFAKRLLRDSIGTVTLKIKIPLFKKKKRKKDVTNIKKKQIKKYDHDVDDDDDGWC